MNMKKTNNTEVKETKKVNIKMIALYAFIGSLIVSGSANLKNMSNVPDTEETVIESTIDAEEM